jgi:hypothetical protein
MSPASGPPLPPPPHLAYAPPAGAPQARWDGRAAPDPVARAARAATYKKQLDDAVRSGLAALLIMGLVAILCAIAITDARVQAIAQPFLVLAIAVPVLALLINLWLELLFYQHDGPVHKLLAAAMYCSVLAGLSFWLLPWPGTRALLVLTLVSAAALSTVWLAARLAWRARLGQRRAVWAGALAVLLAAQGLLAGGLNAYANAQAAPGAALIGDSLAAGRTIAGVSYATIEVADSKVSAALDNLYIPGVLIDYAGQTRAWAAEVAGAAARAEAGGHWQDVPSEAAPFRLTMTAEAAEAAYTAATAQIASLVSYGNYALAHKDTEGLRWVGAGLEAQDYWLHGLYTSADMGHLQAALPFVELSVLATDSSASGGSSPSGSSGLARPAPLADIEMTMGGSSEPLLAANGSWSTPRSWPHVPGNCGIIFCFPVLHSHLLPMVGDITPGPALSGDTDPASDPALAAWEDGQKGMPALLGSDIPTLEETPTTKPVASRGPNAPQPFDAQCRAAGGYTSSTYDESLSSAITAQLPIVAPGWGCHIFNSNCWSYLSETNQESQGGGPGCPTLNLVPPPFGTAGEMANWVAGLANSGNEPTSAPVPEGSGGPELTAGPTNAPAAYWDGTYAFGGISGSKCTGPAAKYANLTSFETQLQQVLSSHPTFAVQNNAIVGGNYFTDGSDLAIDAAGHAWTTWTLPGVTMRLVWVFSHNSAGGVMVNVSELVVEPNLLTCTLTLSGTRN